MGGIHRRRAEISPVRKKKLLRHTPISLVAGDSSPTVSVKPTAVVDPRT
jgi:hypothetical protein